MNKVMWSVSAASILVVSIASAQAATPGIDQRQANQEQRIDKGIAGGQLTGREANRLNNQQEHINKIEDNVKSDGVVTKKERKKVHAAQDRASRKIARQKHDQQTK
jgi:opacity protein-like surface antigen